MKTSNETDSKVDIAGWLRRRADWGVVTIPGKLAGEIADLIESLQSQAQDARNAAFEQAKQAVSDHNRKGREFLPDSLWGTLTREAEGRINELKNQHVRLNYVEGVGTVAVWEK